MEADAEARGLGSLLTNHTTGDVIRNFNTEFMTHSWRKTERIFPHEILLFIEAWINRRQHQKSKFRKRHEYSLVCHLIVGRWWWGFSLCHLAYNKRVELITTLARQRQLRYWLKKTQNPDPAWQRKTHLQRRVDAWKM